MKVIKSWLAGLILKIMGWKVTTAFPADVRKALYVVAPHTSMWDFPFGILVRNYLKIPIGYVIKAELMKGPIGWLLNWMGAYPVDRSKANNFVDGVVQVINKNDDIHICITPEGMRRPVKTFKKGFWYMAKNANVPLILVKFDFENKVLDFSDLYWCTDIDKDMKHVWNHFKGVQGHTPKNGIHTPYIERTKEDEAP